LFKKIDCYGIPVGDLEAAVTFYSVGLGHELKWRTATAAGLRLPDSDTELVLNTEYPDLETDLLVESVDLAVDRFVQAGGKLVKPPFDIAVGRCAIVEDPWGNHLVMLDLSRGLFVTDADRSVMLNADGSYAVARQMRSEHSQPSPDPQIAISPLRREDCGTLAAAFQAIGWAKPISLFQRYLSEQDRGERLVLVARLDGQIAGYLTVHWVSEYEPFRERGCHPRDH
jgi:predicted enzyme related to lactoylglutathione lyase